MPTMIPTVPSQPKDLFYPVTALEMCPRLTRAKYLEMFGVQAPAWNPAEREDFTGRIKRWFDSSAAKQPHDGAYTYNYYEWSGTPPQLVQRTQTITNAEAAVPNLPGEYSYAKWTPSPPDAFVAIETGAPDNPVYVGKRPMDTRDVCEEVSAEAIYNELKRLGFTVSMPEQQAFPAPLVAIYGKGETRRPWRIAVRSVNPDTQAAITRSYAIGALLEQRYANGLETPGHWELEERGILTWISDIPADNGEHDLRPEIPIPMRSLLPTETAVVTPFGNYVGHKDGLESQPGPAAVSNDQIYTLLTEILQRLVTLEQKAAG